MSSVRHWLASIVGSRVCPSRSSCMTRLVAEVMLSLPLLVRVPFCRLFGLLSLLVSLILQGRCKERVDVVALLRVDCIALS